MSNRFHLICCSLGGSERSNEILCIGLTHAFYVCSAYFSFCARHTKGRRTCLREPPNRERILFSPLPETWEAQEHRNFVQFYQQYVKVKMIHFSSFPEAPVAQARADGVLLFLQYLKEEVFGQDRVGGSSSQRIHVSADTDFHLLLSSFITETSRLLKVFNTLVPRPVDQSALADLGFWKFSR
ncbi:hypothetical protein MTO96_035029 [Rhipicephalus appendiculatus]